MIQGGAVLGSAGLDSYEQATQTHIPMGTGRSVLYRRALQDTLVFLSEAHQGKKLSENSEL